MIDYDLIQASGTLVLSIVSLIVVVWLAFKSPQAKLAKLQIKERSRMLREDHYARLDQHIFRPFSSIIASSPPTPTIEGKDLFQQLKLVYDLSSIRSSLFYSDALNHIQKDFPGLEEEINETERGVLNLNSDVNTLRKEVEQTVRLKLSNFAEISRKWPTQRGLYLPNVMTILKGCWSIILYRNIDLKKPLDQIISELQPLETDFSKKTEPDGSVWFGGYALMRDVTSDKQIQIVSIMEQLRIDAKILDKLIKLKKQHNELISKSRQIAKKFEELSRKIDAKKYDTVVSCCPHKL